MVTDDLTGTNNLTVCGSCQDAAHELYKLWEEPEEEVVEVAIQLGDTLDEHSCDDGYDIRRACDCLCLALP